MAWTNVLRYLYPFNELYLLKFIPRRRRAELWRFFGRKAGARAWGAASGMPPAGGSFSRGNGPTGAVRDCADPHPPGR